MTPMLARASYEDLRDSFRWDLPPVLNMAEQVCDSWAVHAPDRVAIIDTREGTPKPYSYRDLWRLSRRVEAALVRHGVLKGDRVGVLLAQSPLGAAAHIAAWRLGAISVPLFKLFAEGALRSVMGTSS